MITTSYIDTSPMTAFFVVISPMGIEVKEDVLRAGLKAGLPELGVRPSDKDITRIKHDGHDGLAFSFEDGRLGGATNDRQVPHIWIEPSPDPDLRVWGAAPVACCRTGAILRVAEIVEVMIGGG